MNELSGSQRARLAIRTFKTIADALVLRGYYRPSGKTGDKLSESLMTFDPEIYGTMSDHRMVELHGLEYVMDRMPRGIERCTRIILTAGEDFRDTSFKKVTPLKRRRLSYIVSEKEICFVISRGMTEVYDILTHLTFLNIEAQKIHRQICNKEGGTCTEWHDLEKVVRQRNVEGAELDQAIWNLSIILGRTYRETRESYNSLEGHRTRAEQSNSGLFAIIHALGQRIIDEVHSTSDFLTVYFTPSLQEMIGLHRYASIWAGNVKRYLFQNNLARRKIHIVSANMHSMKNIFYGAGYLKSEDKEVPDDLYDMIADIREHAGPLNEFATKFGFTSLEDTSESNIDVMIIDTAKNIPDNVHPSIHCDFEYINEHQPLIIVIDYAFGAQAFDILDELLDPDGDIRQKAALDTVSISIMGKAGTLGGSKGDIMLATAHVMEGTPNNYIVENDLEVTDFDKDYPIQVGPMVTVLGTSLQNRDVLARFHDSNWRAVGLEMEGGHYQRAISAAIIRGHVSKNVRTRYAYYASDNPLHFGETLASGSMGIGGVVPTYMITRVFLEKIINPSPPATCDS